MDSLSILVKLVKGFEKVGFRADLTCAHSGGIKSTEEERKYLSFVVTTLRISKDDLIFGYIDLRGQKYSSKREDKFPRLSSIEVFNPILTSLYKSPHLYELSDEDIIKELVKIIKSFTKEVK